VRSTVPLGGGRSPLAFGPIATWFPMDDLLRDLMKLTPMFVVWTVGLLLALNRWRCHPRVSALVAASCTLSIVTTVAFTLAAHRLSEVAQFGLVFGLAWTGVSAVATGLLLWAALVRTAPAPASRTPGAGSH